jgi:hypothetical protein
MILFKLIVFIFEKKYLQYCFIVAVLCTFSPFSPQLTTLQQKNWQ